MPSQDDMKAALQAYIDGFNAGDAAAVTALFAVGATVEDPVGTPPITGLEGVAEFYTNAIAAGAKLALDTPIRGSHGNTAAMAFTVEMPNMRIHVIDVMTFDDDGKITEMRAHWGPTDIDS